MWLSRLRTTSLLCLLGGGTLAVMLSSHVPERAVFTPDSRMYHANAVNILLGKGYHSYPVGALGDYDASVATRFSAEEVRPSDTRPAMNLTPGYPLFLAAIYRVHGVRPDVVVRYQIALAALTGAAMVMIGHLMWGRLGVAAAMGAILLLGNNPEAQYPIGSILTECLTMFFLTTAFAGALWAKRGGCKREVAVGVLISAATLTRPACVFTGLVYGAMHLLSCSANWRRRAFVFAAPCVLILGLWSAWASLQAGRFVPLSSIGKMAVSMGLRGESAASLMEQIKREGLPEDEFNRRLHGVTDEKLGHQLLRIVRQPLAHLRLQQRKLQQCIERMPRAVWCTILCGFALVAMTWSGRGRRPDGVPADEIAVIPRGVLAYRRCVEGLLLIASASLLLVALGFSRPFIQLGFLILPVLAPLFRIEIAPEAGDEAGGAPCGGYWILSWLFGYLLVVVMGPPLSRYMRPFLPVLYIHAVLAAPLLVRALFAVRGGSLGGKRPVLFRWRAIERQRTET